MVMSFFLNQDYMIKELRDRVAQLEESFNSAFPVLQALAARSAATQLALHEHMVIPFDVITKKTEEIISSGNLKLSVAKTISN